MHLDRVVLDHDAGPDPRHQVVLADQLAGRRCQCAQDVEAARPERDAVPVAVERSAANIQSKRPERNLTIRIGRHAGCIRRLQA
jgi:hypothetical protein